MKEIKVKLRIDLDNECEDDVMRRLSSIVCWQPTPQRQSSGYDWVLDDSNDWWAEIDSIGYLKIAYRYGGAVVEQMEALQVYLAWVFGVRSR